MFSLSEYCLALSEAIKGISAFCFGELSGLGITIYWAEAERKKKIIGRTREKYLFPGAVMASGCYLGG